MSATSLDSYSPEQVEEAECFYRHSNHGPLAKDEEHAGKEADGASNLLLPREKVECLLRSDEKCNASREEHIAERKEGSVKEEQDAHKDEEGSKRHEARADFCSSNEIRKW